MVRERAGARVSRPLGRRRTRRSCACCCPARVGGQADDPLRRPGRRGASRSSSARPSSSRSRSRFDPHGGRILVDQLVAPRRRRSRSASRRELPRRARRARTTRRSGSSPAATRRAPRTWPRPTGSSPAGRGSASSRAAPGATQAAVGVHTAYQDSTPLILLVGQVPRAHLGREAFQELDYARMFGGIAKWVAAGRRRRRDARATSRARSHLALSGRPGPVVVALPEDVLLEEADVEDAAPFTLALVAGRGEDLDAPARAARGVRAAARDRRRAAAGATGRRGRARLRRGVELPVAASFRCQDYVDNRSRCYAGVLTSAWTPTRHAVREADLILALGGRLGEIADAAATRCSSRRGRGRRSSTSIPTRTSSVASTSRTSRSPFGRPSSPAALRPARAGRRAAGGVDARGARGLRGEPPPQPRPGPTSTSARSWRTCASGFPTTRPTYGAGNFTVWAHRFYEFRRTARSSRRARARWATASRPRSRRSWSIPTGSSSASRATATS